MKTDSGEEKWSLPVVSVGHSRYHWASLSWRVVGVASVLSCTARTAMMEGEYITCSCQEIHAYSYYWGTMGKVEESAGVVSCQQNISKSCGICRLSWLQVNMSYYRSSISKSLGLSPTNL